METLKAYLERRKRIRVTPEFFVPRDKFLKDLRYPKK
jgi:hypothetical protein